MLIVVALLALAAPSAPPPKPPPVDCRDMAHRALDFWVGEWIVTDTRSGVTIARSTVERIAGDCAIRETYAQDVGPGGKTTAYHGASYSALNNADATWRQLYVDTQGAAFAYTGGLEKGAMVLTAKAASVSNRMTLRPMPDGTVRQSGELTLDGGATWTPGYQFTYRRP